MAERLSGGSVQDPVAGLIHKELPDWSEDQAICIHCMNRFGAKFVQISLRMQKDELSKLEADAAQGVDDLDILPPNINVEFEQNLSFGQRVADKVTDFGGSWSFIGIYICVLAVWVTINSIRAFWPPFDPYPYIFLNLILSALATFQAPIILMSQNRQDQKDRLRAEYDYQVNLQAELEIRRLDAKVDHIMTKQWTRLLEIQQIQLDMMKAYCKSLGDIKHKDAQTL